MLEQFSTCCDAQLSLKSLDHSELSSMDAIWVPWEQHVHPYPGAQSWAAGHSVQGQAAASLHLLYSLPGRGGGMNTKALCGWKGGIYCQSKPWSVSCRGGNGGTECPYQAVLVAVCGTELTLLDLHVTHSYSVICFSSTGASCSSTIFLLTSLKAGPFLVSTLGARVENSAITHIPQISEISIH